MLLFAGMVVRGVVMGFGALLFGHVGLRPLKYVLNFAGGNWSAAAAIADDTHWHEY